MGLYFEEFKNLPHLLMQFGQVKRFNTVYSIIDESIGEHSNQLSYLIILYKTKYPKLFSAMSFENLLVRATLHDCVVESITGDIVSPTKYANTKTTEGFEELEEFCAKEFCKDKPEEFEEYLRMACSFGDINDIEQTFFKMLDLLCLSIKTYNELRLGNVCYKRLGIEAPTHLKTKLAQFFEAASVSKKYDLDVLSSFANWFNEEITPVVVEIETMVKNIEIANNKV